MSIVVTNLPSPPSTDYTITLNTEDDFDVTTQGDVTKSYTITGNDDDNTITGGNRADVISGGLGDNTLNGGGGNDWFITGDPQSGNNVIDGQTGNHDTVDYSRAAASVTIDLDDSSGYGFGT